MAAEEDELYLVLGRISFRFAIIDDYVYQLIEDTVMDPEATGHIGLEEVAKRLGKKPTALRDTRDLVKLLAERIAHREDEWASDMRAALTLIGEYMDERNRLIHDRHYYREGEGWVRRNRDKTSVHNIGQMNAFADRVWELTSRVHTLYMRQLKPRYNRVLQRALGLSDEQMG